MYRGIILILATMSFNNKTKTIETHKTEAQRQNEIMRSVLSQFGYRNAHTMSLKRLRSAFKSEFNKN